MKKTLIFKEDVLSYLDGYFGSVDDIKYFINSYQLIPKDAASDYFKNLIKEDRDHWLEALQKMDFTKEKIAEILADQDNDVRAVVDVNNQISQRYDQVFSLLPNVQELSILIKDYWEDYRNFEDIPPERQQRIVKLNALKKIIEKLDKEDDTKVTHQDYSDFEKETDDDDTQKTEQ